VRHSQGRAAAAQGVDRRCNGVSACSIVRCVVSRDFCFRYFDAGMPQAYEAVLDIANSEESEYTCVKHAAAAAAAAALLLRLLLPILQILHATQ